MLPEVTVILVLVVMTAPAAGPKKPVAVVFTVSVLMLSAGAAVLTPEALVFEMTTSFSVVRCAGMMWFATVPVMVRFDVAPPTSWVDVPAMSCPASVRRLATIPKPVFPLKLSVPFTCTSVPWLRVCAVVLVNVRLLTCVVVVKLSVFAP